MSFYIAQMRHGFSATAEFLVLIYDIPVSQAHSYTHAKAVQQNRLT